MSHGGGNEHAGREPAHRGLAFDSQKSLWVQQYIDQNNPTPASPSPAGGDYIIRIDKSILTTRPADIAKVPMMFYKVPTAQTVMHRIVQGPDKNIWFTEPGSNKVEKLTRQAAPRLAQVTALHVPHPAFSGRVQTNPPMGPRQPPGVGVRVPILVHLLNKSAGAERS